MGLRIGIDLGGTKIEVIALDGSREVFRKRIPTPQGDYAATVQAIRILTEDLDGTLGIGIPGALSRATGLVKNANSTCLIGKPFQQDLEKALGRPVRIANDANCFALSEATDGAAKGAEVVFGVILGTGVGGGIVVRGKVLTGPNAIAGEWGHNPLPLPTQTDLPLPACYCGRKGCIEAYLSGPAFARDAKVASAEEAEKDEAAMARYEERLARALSHVVNIVDPDVIVLGGGLSKIERLYESVPRLWGNYVFSDRVDTRLVPPVHGDSSGVRGAAWLWGEGEA